LTDGGDEGEEDDAVRARRCGGGSGGEQDEPVGERKTMRQGGDLGGNGRGDGGGCPSLYDRTFWACPWTRATP